MWDVSIDEVLCKRCGICSALCPVTAFTVDEIGLPVFACPEKCIGCGLCVLRCPDIALALIERKEV